ncbi:MAG TPA: protein phosphatase 2C domain-containing protein [Polyangiaceae bacterium]
MEAAPSLPAVEYAERSDPGRDPDKQVNEDACGHAATRFGHLCVVCDGMGGHAAGKEAAELALATVLEVFEKADPGTPPGQVLKASIEEASRRVNVMRTSEVALGRPGSTAVALLLHAGGTEVAHVGDSRAYLVHEGQIFRVTRDHSMVQELVDRGLLTPAQAAHHPDANRITRALGMSNDVEAELRAQPVQHLAGDAFVLCSDGLSDLVEDHEILAVVAAEPAAQAVGKLVDLANARGGHDNVTVIVLKARESVAGTTVSVAPTLAQTTVTAPPTTVPETAPAPPVVVGPPPAAPAAAPSAPAPAPPADATPRHKTEPGAAGAVIPPAPEPAPPLVAAAERRRKRSPWPVILGIVLALAAFTLLAAVLLSHLAERSGKPSATPSRVFPDVDGEAATAAPLVPKSAAPAPPLPPPEPITPLVPTPSASTPRHGRPPR